MLGWQTLQRHYLNLTAPDGASMNWNWQRCRRAFLKKVGKKCVMCSSKKKVEVHHIIPRNTRPDLAVDHRNLIALCGGGKKGCHLKHGHMGSYMNYNAGIKKIAFFSNQHSVLRDNKKAA